MLNSHSAVSLEQQDLTTDHFLVGQDLAGRWLVLETHHRSGGVFKSRQSAIRFVEFETGHRAGAYELSSTPLSMTF